MEDSFSDVRMGRDLEYAVHKQMVGSGAFGDAYKVTRLTDDKVFLAKLTREAGLYSMAETEAKRLQDLDSEYIVRYIDSFPFSDGLRKLHVTVMEYCDGICPFQTHTL